MADPLQPATPCFKNYAYVQSKIYKTVYMYVAGHCTFYTRVFGPQLVLVIWQQDYVWVVDEMGWANETAHLILKSSSQSILYILSWNQQWYGVVCAFTPFMWVHGSISSISVGCGAWYKRKKPMRPLANNFDVPPNTLWNFCGLRHDNGKGDGESAVINGTLTRSIATQSPTLTPWEKKIQEISQQLADQWFTSDDVLYNDNDGAHWDPMSVW